MANDNETPVTESAPRLRSMFWDKRFLHYTVIGLFISAINVALLWLLIDVFGIPTVVAGTIVVGVTFLLRYVLLLIFKVV